MGAMRKRTPAALLETGETSVRAEQRIDALSSVLRSVPSFVVWLTALLMCLGEVGINLGPLLAGAGVLGVAVGFGSRPWCAISCPARSSSARSAASAT
jgi:small conductance mechanosensitive channel